MQTKAAFLGSFCLVAVEMDSQSHTMRMDYQTGSQEIADRALHTIHNGWGISIPFWQSGTLTIEIRNERGRLVGYAEYEIDFLHYKIYLTGSGGYCDNSKLTYEMI